MCLFGCCICLHIGYKCFIWILRMFYMGFKYFQVFLQIFQMHVLNVSSVLRRMLQVLHLDVLKVDQVLHPPPHFLMPCILLRGRQRGPVRGWQWMRARALPFNYAGRNRLPWDSCCQAGITASVASPSRRIESQLAGGSCVRTCCWVGRPGAGRPIITIAVRKQIG